MFCTDSSSVYEKRNLSVDENVGVGSFLFEKVLYLVGVSFVNYLLF